MSLRFIALDLIAPKHHFNKSADIFMCTCASKSMCECLTPVAMICACTGCSVMVYALTYHALHHATDPEHAALCVHKHVFAPACVFTCMQTCVFMLSICCIWGDAALCLPQWSIWKAVREMNDCRYIDYCSLPRCCLRPLFLLTAPCSISPFLRPSTSPPLPFFTFLPVHLFSTPLFPTFSFDVSPF